MSAANTRVIKGRINVGESYWYRSYVPSPENTSSSSSCPHATRFVIDSWLGYCVCACACACAYVRLWRGCCACACVYHYFQLVSVCLRVCVCVRVCVWVCVCVRVCCRIICVRACRGHYIRGGGGVSKGRLRRTDGCMTLLCEFTYE